MWKSATKFLFIKYGDNLSESEGELDGIVEYENHNLVRNLYEEEA